MSSEIIVMEKPDSVSWDSIHDVMWSAHESTRKDGINYPQAEMTGNEIKEFIEGHNGHCVVAMDKDVVVGTMSYYITDVNTKLFKGKFLMLALAGNSPEYKGRGVFSKIYNECYNFAKANGLEGILFGTAEKNHTMRKIFEKKGFIYDRCYFHNAKKRFVVGGFYYFNELPHKKSYYVMRFKLKQMFMHLRYTNKGKKRFGI